MTRSNKFPSPCGEWVRKASVLSAAALLVVLGKFPSPCGEWVRKVSFKFSKTNSRNLRFRPLAGNGLGKFKFFSF